MAHGTQESALDLTKTTKTRRDRIQVVADTSLYGHGHWPVEYLPVRQPYYAGFHVPLSSELIPGCIVSRVAPEPGVAGYHLYQSQHVSSAQLSPVSEVSSCEPSSPPARAVEVYDPLATPEYMAYEAAALDELAARNGGSLLPDNPKMRRAVQTSSTSNTQDDSYKRQREKNNASAKASRDKRKLKEMKLTMQANYLKKKVAELEERLAARRCSRCEVREC